MVSNYVPRLLDAELRTLFAELPAVMLVGPRATGKTTTAAQLAKTLVRLDRPAEAAAFAADPDVALAAAAEPVLLDEWQAAPSVLGAVKRAVDADPRPGRFLLTGSVRADLEAETWPGTGRIVRLSMFGLTQRELTNQVTEQTFIERLAANDLSRLTPTATTPDLAGYIDLALAGGYPEAVLRLSGTARNAWLDGYLDQLLTRDAAGATGRNPAQLRRYFQAIALNTAGVVDHKTLYDAAQINRLTAVAYDSLLAGLYVVDEVPAWLTNRLSRLAKTSKRYVVDTSLVVAALGLTRETVLKDGDLLGRIMDTFVAAQIRPELGIGSGRVRLHHLREKNGRHEVDLLPELSAHAVVGVEVKANAAPSREDAKHLIWLREQLGDRFAAGAVLHTGPGSFAIDDRVYAVPIATLWGCGG